MRVIKPHALIVGAQRAIPFVKSVVGRPASVFCTDVPLAEARGNISGLRENFGNGLLPLDEAAGIAVVLGGTFWEVCFVQNKLDRWREWVMELGLRHVEISDGTVALPHERKLEYIADMAQDFTVLSEVGSKDNDVVIAPYRWVEMIEAELRAGAWKVITEARESGTAGVFRGDGEVRMGLIDEIVHAVDVHRLLFEAPQKSQQTWFIRSDIGHDNTRAVGEMLAHPFVHVGASDGGAHVGSFATYGDTGHLLGQFVRRSRALVEILRDRDLMWHPAPGTVLGAGGVVW